MKRTRRAFVQRQMKHVSMIQHDVMAPMLKAVTVSMEFAWIKHASVWMVSNWAIAIIICANHIVPLNAFMGLALIQIHVNAMWAIDLATMQVNRTFAIRFVIQKQKIIMDASMALVLHQIRASVNQDSNWTCMQTTPALHFRRINKCNKAEDIGLFSLLF